MTLDLKQFQRIFFEEAFEGLDAMESALVAAADTIVDMDVINTLFRAAHSMKGGSATFGYADLTRFTHRIETLLDQVRHGTRPLDEGLIGVLLKAVDGARNLLRVLCAGGQPEPQLLAASEEALNALLACPPQPRGCDLGMALLPDVRPDPRPPSGPDPAAPSACPAPGPNTPDAAPAPGWRIRFRPQRGLLAQGNDVVLLFRELSRLGPLTVRAEVEDLPTLAALVAADCYLAWSLDLAAAVPEASVREIFDWVADACDLELVPQGPAPPAAAGLVHGTPAAAPAGPERGAPPAATLAVPRGASIRVDTDKVDALVDLVGELVITQSMLQPPTGRSEGLAAESVRRGMAQLERNIRELQGQVLGIRMLPIGYVFYRFPRLVHDLALALGKRVDFHLGGEQTELDKRLIELVADPLTHLLRNAMDHGLETPAVRRERGKPETGTLRLTAAHRAGSIFITVADDGAGIDRVAVAARARELGLAGPVESLDPEQLLRVLCHPGLSTRTTVTALSGRGVGLDVVERNIRALGGRLELATVPGVGTRFTIRIPLTLAILDGQLLRVGPEVYILPLVSIVETEQVDPQRLCRLPGALEVYQLRGRHLPVVRLAALLGVPPDEGAESRPVLVIVEVDDGDLALMVDELLGQQQVVIKGLEANFRKVAGVSAATVLGDGRVRLILDGTELKRLAAPRMAGTDGRQTHSDDSLSAGSVMIAIDNRQVPNACGPAAPRQFLTFVLADIEYGLDILKVREIRVWEPVTPLPNTQPFVKGVINLRGSVVPIIDLRERLGLPALSYGPRTVVIVVNVTQGEGEKVMGMVVDAVCDEHLLDNDLISPPPDLGGPIRGAFVAGLVQVQGRLIVLLDSDRLLGLAVADPDPAPAPEPPRRAAGD